MNPEHQHGALLAVAKRLIPGLALLSVNLVFVFHLLAPNLASAQMEMKPGMQHKEMKKDMQMEMATEGVFEGKGKIIALVPEKDQVVLQHDEIKGFMTAMTMGYPVESKNLMYGLKAGDMIKFKIDAAQKKIIAVERLNE
jgi:Cu/Ag efflux protein CusF